MISCKFNYSVEDNIKANEILFKEKNRRKTNIVALLLIVLTLTGVTTSISAIINHQKNWYVGFLSVALLACYFLVDVVVLKREMAKQKEFYMSTQLRNVTKLEIVKTDTTLTEVFYVGEQIIGKNEYDLKKVTYFKSKGDYIFLIFEEQYVVLIKKAVLTEKHLDEFMQIYNALKPKKVNKIKKNQKNDKN